MARLLTMWVWAPGIVAAGILMWPLAVWQGELRENPHEEPPTRRASGGPETHGKMEPERQPTGRPSRPEEDHPDGT